MASKYLEILVLVAFAQVQAKPENPKIPGITNLRIINGAAAYINDTVVTEVNPKEWASENAPQNNFCHVQIPSGGSVTREEDVNLGEEVSHFAMVVTFSDGTKEEFGINQQMVFEGSADFTRGVGTRYITYGTTSNHTLVITIKD